MKIFSKPRVAISFLFLLFITFTISPVLAAAASKPQVTDNMVSRLQNVSVQLNGYVNPGGLKTSCRFRYGTSTAYGKSTSPYDIGSGTGWVEVNSGLFLLIPGTTYYYRLEATNSAGTTYGRAKSFRTYSSPQKNTKPTVTTGAAYKVTSSSGVLAGVINPNGDDATWYFRYGKTADYGSSSEFKHVVGSREPVSVSVTISSLKGGTTYHYCLCGYNGKGQTIGTDRTFSTTDLPVEKNLPLPTNKTSFPAYLPAIVAETGIDPSACKPIGVGDIAEDGDTVGINLKLENPSGPYDAYLALNAPAINPDEYFMLGEDGIFHPFSQSGLVKWKKSASGKIDEQPFGSFPVSQLPGGTYNFNFMLTPADSRDAYYLWQTSFFVPETQINVPDGSAGFFNGTLVAPNAIILSGGQVYENSAPVSKDELTAIKKDGKMYLYHPAMEQVELSEENTKLAVAYFMTGLSTSEIKAIKEQMKRGVSQVKAEAMTRSISTDTIPYMLSKVGDEVTLDTGIKITLQSDVGQIEANNNRRRFAVVKTGKTNENQYLLLPRDSLIPTELLAIANCFLPDGGWIRDDIQAFNKIETFGAFARLSEKARMGSFNEDQREALEKDKSLVTSLNKVDMSYFILEGIRQTTSLVIPTRCSTVAINAIARIVERELVDDLFTDDEQALWHLDKTVFDGMLSNLVGCCTQALLLPTVVGPLAIEAATKFLSVISLAQWTFNKGYESFLTYLGVTVAYDLALANVGIDDMVAYLSIGPSGANQEIARNMDERTSWVVHTDPNVLYHRIIGMTPGGVVLSYWEGDPKKFVTTTNWGRGTQTDIGSTCELCGDRLIDPAFIDISDSGRLFFQASKCWQVETSRGEKTIRRSGVYTVMADGKGGDFVPIVIDQTELGIMGYDNIEIEALSVSGNGKVLAFSVRNSETYKSDLYSVEPSGENLRLLASSNNSIDTININHSGDMIIFDYTTPSFKTLLYAVPAGGGTAFELSMAPGHEIFSQTAAISPDGWVACVGGDIDKGKIGIELIRSDGSDYHFVETKSNGIVIMPYADYLPLGFTQSGKSVVFSGRDLMSSDKLDDIFAVEIDPEVPFLGYPLIERTETDKNHKRYPVLW